MNVLIGGESGIPVIDLLVRDAMSAAYRNLEVRNLFRASVTGKLNPRIDAVVIYRLRGAMRTAQKAIVVPGTLNQAHQHISVKKGEKIASNPL